MKKAGFTLIELLVVVLIIGILAAVALPQYQKAVEKAQLSALIPLVKAVVNAKTAYYLETGEYARKFEDLSVTLPSNFRIADDSYYGQYANWKQTQKYIFLDSGSHSVAARMELSDNSLVWFYIEMNGKQTCTGTAGKRAEQLCKSLPGATFAYSYAGSNTYTIKY